MTYDFEICYRKGKLTCFDYLSRHPVMHPPDKLCQGLCSFYRVVQSVPNAHILLYIANATQDNATLQNIIKSVKTNNWSEKLCQIDKTYGAIAKLFDELTVLEVDEFEILLRGTRLGIPQT